MLRSFALAFSIGAFRVWMFIAFTVFVPEISTGAEVDPADMSQAIGVTSWVSWVGQPADRRVVAASPSAYFGVARRLPHNTG